MRFLNSNKRLPLAGRPSWPSFIMASLPPSRPFDRFLPLFLQPFSVINHFPKRKVHGARDDAFAQPRSSDKFITVRGCFKILQLQLLKESIT